MAIIITDDGSRMCAECGQNFTDCDLYRCDGCDRIICADCLPMQEAFTAAEFCEKCMED